MAPLTFLALPLPARAFVTFLLVALARIPFAFPAFALRSLTIIAATFVAIPLSAVIVPIIVAIPPSAVIVAIVVPIVAALPSTTPRVAASAVVSEVRGCARGGSMRRGSNSGLQGHGEQARRGQREKSGKREGSGTHWCLRW